MEIKDAYKQKMAAQLKEWAPRLICWKPRWKTPGPT